MESKVTKIKTHPRNFCKEELIVNIDAFSKEKFYLKAGDIIEVLIPETENSYNRAQLFLQVEHLPQDIQSKGGPLSISKELAQTFNLDGLREVCVKKVERDDVGLDLIELRFKDQCLTQSDMWRFSCSLIGKCVYLSKKMEFAGIRCQVSELWSQGEKVHCGAVVDSTRVVYRSVSAHFFIFIQISSEMWEFDPSGDLYFDKAESGFLKELFRRWKEERCNHEVTLIFFWRMYYAQDTLDKLPPAILKDKRGNYYEDFFKVIAQGESMTDWASCLVDIKRNFLCLKNHLLLMRGRDTVSPAAEGNILEAINLAVNVYENNYQDCSFQLTGQQVVIVTAGVGVFEVERDLTMMTKERIIDMGVGVDLISLTEQPLHAVPLFKFHSLAPLDNQEYYNLPHWINYSFYNPVHPWNQYRFKPMLKLSDHLINTHLWKERQCQAKGGSKLYKAYKDITLSPHTHSSSITLKKMRALFNKCTNHDEHDASIFKAGKDVGKVSSAERMKHTSPDDTKRTRHSSYNQEKYLTSKVSFKIASSQENEGHFEADNIGSLTSNNSSSIARSLRSLRDSTTTSPNHSHSSRTRFASDSHDPSSISANASSHTLCPTAGGGSTDSLPKYSQLSERHGKKLDRGGDGQILVTKKKVKFINPFDPLKVHGELTAYHRRWVHTFPRDKFGLAFQTHHAIPREEEEKEGEEDLESVSSTTFNPSVNYSLEGSSYGGQDGQYFRTLQQGGDTGSRKSRGVSVSSSFGEALSGSVRSNSENTGNLNEMRDKSHIDSIKDSKLEPKFDAGSESCVTELGGKIEAIPPSKSISCKKKVTGYIHRRVSSTSTKTVEDFTSIRRTGVDWKSLTEPACLPISVDFFPSESKLDHDYYVSPSKLVVSSYGSDPVSSTASSKNSCSWIADHQKVDTFEAFREMISQRLSQGFQLVFDTSGQKTNGSRWSGQTGTNQASICALHRALSEQKEALEKIAKTGKVSITKGSITVKLSLGKVFQKLELAYPDIFISIYKQKVQYHPLPYIYNYQLCGTGMFPDHTSVDHTSVDHTSVDHTSKDGCVFNKASAKFEYYRMEDYNWNYLDQHVCGHSEFEILQESHKYWRCRYLLLPSTPPPSLDVYALTPNLLEAEEQIKMKSIEETLISNFVRFMEFLNHVKRYQPPVPGSLKRHQSLPASHSTMVTPNRSSIPSHDNISSPISILSSFLAKTPKKLPEIEESLSPPNKNTPTHEPVSSRPESRTRVMTPQASLAGYERGEWQGKDRLRSRRGKGSKSSNQSSSSFQLDDDCDSKFSNQIDSYVTATLNPHIQSEYLVNELEVSPRVSKESPRILRRKLSRDDMVSPVPAHDCKDLSFASVKKETVRRDSTLSLNPRSTSTWRSKNSARNKSPEVVVEDSSCSSSSFDVSIQLLDASSPPQIVLKAMENLDEGLDFLSNHPGLSDGCCFIGMEAVSWVLDKVGGIINRKDAVDFLQSMVEEHLILHASMDLSIPFLDGYIIYCIPSKQDVGSPKDDLERSFLLVSPEYEAFSKHWFEVVIEHSSTLPDQSGRSMNLEPHSPSPSPYTTPYTGLSPCVNANYFCIDYTSRLSFKIPRAMVNHYVELNPDSQFRSDRPEWCFVHYDYNYHPYRGFQFEMQWMVATITLFNQLIQGWTHKAGMCGFNLVPVPMLQNIYEKDYYPFGAHHYIPLNLPSSFPESKLSEAVGKIMTAIVLKSGFILDPASINNDVLDYNVFTNHFYIHHSGSAFVRPFSTSSVMRKARTSSLGTTLGRGDFLDNDRDFKGVGVSEDGGGGGEEVNTGMGNGQRLYGEEALQFNCQRSSTPNDSPSRSVNRELQDTPLQCGFYWFKNTALSRHKTVSASVLAEYENVRVKLVGFCNDHGGELTELCARVLGTCTASPDCTDS